MRRVLALAASLNAGATASGVLMLASQNVSSVEQPAPTPITPEPSQITAAEPAAWSVEVKPAPPSDQVMVA